MDRSDWRAMLWRCEKTHEAVRDDLSKNKNITITVEWKIHACSFQRTDEDTYLLKVQESLAT